MYAFGKMCCYAMFKTTEPKPRQWSEIAEELADMLEKCIEQELEHRLPSFEPVLKDMEAILPYDKRTKPRRKRKTTCKPRRNRKRTNHLRTGTNKDRWSKNLRVMDNWLQQQKREEERQHREQEEADRQTQQRLVEEQRIIAKIRREEEEERQRKQKAERDAEIRKREQWTQAEKKRHQPPLTIFKVKREGPHASSEPLSNEGETVTTELLDGEVGHADEYVVVPETSSSGEKMQSLSWWRAYLFFSLPVGLVIGMVVGVAGDWVGEIWFNDWWLVFRFPAKLICGAIIATISGLVVGLISGSILGRVTARFSTIDKKSYSEMGVSASVGALGIGVGLVGGPLCVLIGMIPPQREALVNMLTVALMGGGLVGILSAIVTTSLFVKKYQPKE